MDKKNIDEFAKKIKDNSNIILEDSLLDKESKLEDTRSFTYDDLVKISTKDKMSKLPWLIAIILILSISLIVGYMFFKYNPQTIFTNTIDNFFSYITSNNFEDSYDITKGTIKIKEENNNFKVNYTIDGSRGVSKYIIDDKDGKITIYNDRQNIYLHDKDIHDGLLKYPSNSYFNNIKYSDLKILLTGINQAIDKVTTTEKIIGSKTNCDLGNRTIKVYESKLVIDSKNYKRVSETLISSIKSNEEFTHTLSRVLEIKNVKESLDNFSFILNDYIKNNEKIEIKICTDRMNHNFVKAEIKNKKTVLNIIKNENININIDSTNLKGNIDYKIKNDKNIIDFDISGNEHRQGEIIITSKKAEKFDKIKMDNVVDMTKLSSEEISEINDKLIQNPYFEKILKWLI